MAKREMSEQRSEGGKSEGLAPESQDPAAQKPKPRKRCIGTGILVGGVHPMPLSRAVRAGDWVHVSGQTAIDQSGAVLQGGIEAQTRRVLDGIKSVLEQAGCSMADVVKTTVWLEDPRDFWSFNRAYAEYFPTEPPARSVVQARLMLDCKVEIEAIAYKPE